jgi:hypothetical protein
LLNALKDGKVDAIYNATPVVNYQLYKSEGYRIIKMDTDENSRAKVGFAVKKEKNTYLRNHFNVGLSQLEGNGIYEKLAEKYFHTDISRSKVETIELPKTHEGFFTTHFYIVIALILVLAGAIVGLSFRLHNIRS